MKLVVAALFCSAIGCVRAPRPTAQYFGPIAASPTLPSDIETTTGTPKEPYEDLGTVEVACPTVAEHQAGAYGGTSQLLGGCSYTNALLYAKEKAGEAGADGLYGIQTSAASNGRIVSLTATAFRFKDGASPSENVSSEGAAPAAPSLEERLRTLQELHDKKLITDQEYEQKKAELLKEI